ncbi:nitroreductase family protein [Chitinophaga defluvii]|uniref:Nitroreductase family protein n=1 Tax=Chitinophaga defluvii TaxID=3163343 RepID=A0ABV2T1P2_9BACT
MSLLEALQWRYATKKMNGQKVPQEKIDRILDATRLSPSSAGLQPYSILVVEDEALREKIMAVSNNQRQIADSSHLLIFAAWKDISIAQVNDFIKLTAQVRNVTVESLEGYKDMLLGVITRNTPEQNFQWAARQAYIAFGIAIAAAATEQVDATPMEGFNAAALDELLGLEEKGLRSVTLLPLGYRDAPNDWLQGLEKVRWPKEKMVLEVAASY